jgi:hypothetical protein
MLPQEYVEQHRLTAEDTRKAQEAAQAAAGAADPKAEPAAKA